MLSPVNSEFAPTSTTTFTHPLDVLNVFGVNVPGKSPFVIFVTFTTAGLNHNFIDAPETSDEVLINIGTVILAPDSIETLGIITLVCCTADTHDVPIAINIIKIANMLNKLYFVFRCVNIYNLLIWYILAIQLNISQDK